jgi:hypothetical protein
VPVISAVTVSEGNLMNGRSAALLTIAALTLAGCGAGDGTTLSQLKAPANGQATALPASNEPFRSGSFVVQVAGISYAVPQIEVSATAEAGGAAAYKPTSGSFTMFYVTATNVGQDPASMSSSSSTVVDTAGKVYTSVGPYAGAVGQGFGVSQPPGTTRSGWLAFDVPESATLVPVLTVQTDASPGTKNPPTPVQFG